MPPSRYSRIAMALHWLLAALLAFQLALGFRLGSLPRGLGAFDLYQLHKSIGMMILLLSLLRLAVRLTRRPPPLLPDAPAVQWMARLVHGGLYLFMIGAPLTGWALVSTAPISVPTVLFHALPLPHLPLPAALNGPAQASHTAMAFIGIALFILHVAGALRHQWLKGEDVLIRMIPAIHRTGAGAWGATATLIAIASTVGWSLTGTADGTPVASAPSADAADAPATAPAPAPIAPSQHPALQQAADATTLPAPGATTADTPAAPAALRRWAVQPGGALGFRTRWNDMPVEGSFTRWKADIAFTPDALDRASIKVTVDLASVSTADAQRDEMLKGDGFFASAAHPSATFTATGFRQTGKDRYAAAGQLMLRGVTRPVRLNFSLKITGDQARASGSAAINRTDFGVGAGEWSGTDQIPAQVDISFDFAARAQP